MDAVSTHIQSVIDGNDLDAASAAEVFNALMAGRLDEQRIETLLTALAAKGEHLEEIVGAATAMRNHVIRIDCDDPNAIDTCGTGGDGISTFNVSTAAAVVAAAAGATVAKHGNRSNSRKSGSAEVLMALGVNIDATPGCVARCMRETGIGFLFAAKLHPAMKHAVAVRKKIGKSTIFNLLGPLTNPAFVKRQVIGVPRFDLMEKIAGALKQLGSERVLVVHGHDGLCDFTATADSSYIDLHEGQLIEKTVRPEDVGLARCSLDDLRITSPEESAAAVTAIFAGEQGPHRDHTLLNAAAALVAAGKCRDLAEGVKSGTEAIDRGAAAQTMRRLRELTNEAST